MPTVRRLLPLFLAIVAVLTVAAFLNALPGMTDSFPEPLLRTFVGVEVWRWLGLLAGIGTTVLGAFIARKLAIRTAEFRDRLVGAPMHRSLREGLGNAAFVLALGLLTSILVSELAAPTRFGFAVGRLAQATTAVGVTMVVSSLWNAFCHAVQERAQGHQRAERLLVPMVRKLVGAVIFIGGLLAVLAVFVSPERISALIAGLGVGGIVVALAAKDSVENLFGSITILLDMPFAIGDVVKIDKIEGTVEEINLRSTRIRTVEDTIVNLPNANLIRAAVENFGERRFRRQTLMLRLSYDCEPQAIADYSQALHDYLEEQPECETGQNLVELNDPTEGSIGLLVRFRLQVATYKEEVAARDKVLREAMALRDPHHIVFAAAPRPLPPTPPQAVS